MNPPPRKLAVATGLVLAGLSVGAAGIYVGDADDAPGAALIGLAPMVSPMVFGIRIALRIG